MFNSDNLELSENSTKQVFLPFFVSLMNLCLGDARNNPQERQKMTSLT